MAVINARAEAPSDQLKDEIKYTTTISSSTLNVLRALLGLDLHHSGTEPQCLAKKPPAPKTTRKPVPSSLKQKPKRPNARSGPEFTIYEPAKATISPLNDDGKRRLATETFNATLKHLSDAAKVAVAGQDGTTPTRERKRSPQKPLQNCSPNRKPQTSIAGKEGQTTQIATTDGAVDLGSVAHCASTSLDYLLRLETAQENTGCENKEWRLERGALLLLDKFTTLKLKVHALEIVSTLRSHFEKRFKISNTRATSPFAQGLVGTQEGDGLAQALVIEITPRDKATFSLLTSFQSQVLRVALLYGRNVINNEFLSVFRPGPPSGPTGVILRGFDEGLLTAEQAAQQLRTLSQALMTLCATSAIETSTVPGDVFQLRCTAIEIRCHAWNLLAQGKQVRGEIWQHFGRAVSRFRDESKASGKEDYNLAKHALSSLQTVAGTTEEHNLPAGVSDLLSDMAQRAGMVSDSLAMLQRHGVDETPETSMSLLLRHCKIATLRLSSFKDDRQASLSTAEQTLDLLKGTLKGTAADMNDLLLFGARLRKACLGVITDVEDDIVAAMVTHVDLSLQICAIRIVFAFLNFVARYLASGSGIDASLIGTQDRFEKKEALLQVAYKTLDAVMNSVKCDNAWSPVLLAETDAALTKCVAMATLLDGRPSIPSQFVRISNCYWAYYLKASAASVGSGEHCLILERAIEILSNRPPSEQEHGSLALKYSKMASLYVEQKLFDRAKKAQMSGIKLLVELGALAEAVELALSGPWQRAWSDQNAKSGMLGKALASLQTACSVQSKSMKHGEFIYDDIALPATHRAVILEKQILICMDLQQPFARDQIIAASGKILEIYGAPAFKICRLRFALNLLICSSKNENVPVFEILGEHVDTIIDVENNSKLFLNSYGKLLKACVQLHWYLQTRGRDRLLLDANLAKLTHCLAQCSKKESLEMIVDSPQNLARLLQSVIDYAGMMCFKSVQVNALQTLLRVLELQDPSDSTALIQCLISMGLLQKEMGDTMDAGRSFATAENLLARPGVSASTFIEWELGFADYLVEISNTQKCSDILLSAGGKYDAQRQQAQQRSTRPGVKQQVMLAQAASIASKLAFAREDLESALLHARQCIKLTTAIWMALEKLWDTVDDHGMVGGREDSMQVLAEGISDLNGSVDRSCSRSTPKGAPFWTHVETHSKALLHLSSLCAHSGLYQDSIYYAEQARKLGVSTHSAVLIARGQCALSLLHSRGPSLEAASKSLAVLDAQVKNVPEGLERCSLHSSQTSSYLAIGKTEMAKQCLTQAENSFSVALKAHKMGTPERFAEELAAAKRMATANLADTRRIKTSRQPRLHPPSRAGRASKSVPTKVSTETSPSREGPQNNALQQLTALTTLQKAQIAYQTGDLPEATSQLGVLTASGASRHNTQLQLLDASVMISRALEYLSADPVHGVLAETTIGLPSKYGMMPSAGAEADIRETTHSTPKIRRGKAILQADSKMPKMGTLKTESEGLLSKAYEILLNTTISNLPATPSDIVHKAHRTLSQLTLMTSVISTETTCSPAHCLSQLLLSKDHMREREAWVMSAEMNSAESSQNQHWPTPSSRKREETFQGAEPEMIVEDSELFNSVPASWTVISLSLSDEKSDLIISRRSASTQPFVLRIPLLRTNADELEQDAFSFQDAKLELTSIVSQANLTAHDARGQGDKAARKVWWSERQELDRRLEALLKNVESIWLGGFRGIMTKPQDDREMLRRLANSLVSSLDKHLPSRQKPGTSNKPATKLHPYVIDLFAALGHPDNNDLEDLVVDLLYFVIDILQFGGERNAYDEIDFDIMVVEILDALRSYHETCSLASNQEQHTILILDNDLHAFPWESLPCLTGQSVSRIPSLAELHDRMKSIRVQNAHGQSLQVSSAKGSYILNPSSDLVSTQETFQATFETQLPDFEGIVNRVPTEKEIESCLQNNSLFLYFGHGSGAQYIRARTIKKLKKCAVTFLMGCSSSKMVECGVYEPYGVPWNYMFAGAPAVVGTLWDVTDKDIDRFAMMTFTNWGLLDGSTIEEEKKGKGKAIKCKKIAKKGRDASPTNVEMALDQAVAKARDSCVLRYLNGAAPVIYGVPVSLGKTAKRTDIS